MSPLGPSGPSLPGKQCTVGAEVLVPNRDAFAQPPGKPGGPGFPEGPGGP